MKQILTQKCCCKCKETKPISEFYKNGKRGYRYQCKTCSRIHSKKWNSKSPDVTKQFSRKSYLLHKEEKNERSRIWHKTHPLNTGGWARKNPEKAKAIIKRWNSTHREAKREHARNRRARILAVGGIITKEEWIALCDKYDNQCLCCGKKDVPITLDHIVPLSKGGKHSIDNAQLLCKPCNSKKGTKTVDYRHGIITLSYSNLKTGDIKWTSF